MLYNNNEIDLLMSYRTKVITHIVNGWGNNYVSVHYCGDNLDFKIFNYFTIITSNLGQYNIK